MGQFHFKKKGAATNRRSTPFGSSIQELLEDKQ